MRASCCRCGVEGPVVPETEIIERREEGVAIAYCFCPPGFVPVLEPGEPVLTCLSCGTDEEIVKWFWSEAWRTGAIYDRDC